MRKQSEVPSSDFVLRGISNVGSTSPQGDEEECIYLFQERNWQGTQQPANAEKDKTCGSL